jgi:hypothetical protein
MVKIQRNLNPLLEEFSRSENRYQQGKLVSSRYYTVSSDKPRLINFDSFAYAGNKKVYNESIAYEADGSIRSGSREKISYTFTGLPGEIVAEVFNSDSLTWMPGWKDENEYTGKKDLLSTSHYWWNSASAEWVLSSTAYLKYDALGRLVETGQFTGTDSLWEIRHYYTVQAKPYKPADAPLKLLISPNPVTSSIHANIYSTDYFTVRFTLFDALGRAITNQSFEVVPGPNSIDILPREALRPGCYPYCVQTGTNAPATGKLMVVE